MPEACTKRAEAELRRAETKFFRRAQSPWLAAVPHVKFQRATPATCSHLPRASLVSGKDRLMKAVEF